MKLSELGYSEHFASQMERLDPGLIPLRVCIEYKDRFLLVGRQNVQPEGDGDADDGRVWGRLRGGLHADPLDRPAVGDWVAVRAEADSDQGIIVALLGRSSRFVRQAAGRPLRPQVVAANIDTVFVVTSLNRDFNVRRIERYLATVIDSGATPVLVLNKSDLCADSARFVAKLGPTAASVPIETVSALEHRGLESLQRHLAPGKTAALVGSSGVGKSTIVNWILGREAQKVARIRKHDAKGRHTTTHRELIPLGDHGLLIDTPGMREIKLWVDEDAVDAAFADIHELAAKCRFRDCRHVSEPHCAVRAAADAGELDQQRLLAYQKLRAGDSSSRPPRSGSY